ncbi:MAG: autotransporter domain-containing protein [Burkholderiaceae bacterium]|nr:autotransporter domain-containing protein [Sulfuritalea sp.]MCF8176706.1 autotransporter domain-containing protein [Burkholderiaceae bacterium]
MKNKLAQFWIVATLLCASGSVAASGSVNLSNCDTSGVTQASGGGLTGSGSCDVTYTDGINTASGTVSASFSGYSASLSGSLTGAFTFFAGSGTKSGTEQGYLWTCTASNTGGVGSTTISGSCSISAGGVAGATSSSGAQQQAQATVVQQVNTISNVIGARMLSNVGGQSSTKQASSGSGMAAGNIAEKWNGWAALGQNNSSYSPSDTTKKRATDVTNAVVGADYQISPTMVLGISAAFDRGTGSVGAGAAGTNSNGLAFAPYLGVQLGPNMALDLSAGFGKGEAGQAGGIKAESDRQFYAANLGYVQWTGNLQFSGKLGYLASSEKYGDIKTNGVTSANTGTKNEIEQMNLGAEVGYWMNGGIMPFLGVVYSKDTRLKTAFNDPDWDKDSFILKLGVNFLSIANKVTGGIAYTEESGRRNAKNATLMGNINFRF